MAQSVEERRIQLHEELIDILGTANQAESRVYYQPPESVKMSYPAIVYERDGGSSIRADNGVYKFKMKYTVTVVDPDPDSDIAIKILKHFCYSRIGTRYIADNLNHDIVEIYY